MSCDTYPKKATKAAGAAGIAALASRTAAHAKPMSPQSRWAELDRQHQTENPKAALHPFQAQRRQAVANNVKQFHQAIKDKQKVAVIYRGAGGWQKYKAVIPLDVKGGAHPSSQHLRYMWVYLEAQKRPTCFRLERIAQVEPLAETFDPVALAQQVWKGKKVQFNLPRDWAEKPGPALRQAKAKKEAAKKGGPRSPTPRV